LRRSQLLARVQSGSVKDSKTPLSQSALASHFGIVPLRALVHVVRAETGRLARRSAHGWRHQIPGCAAALLVGPLIAMLVGSAAAQQPARTGGQRGEAAQPPAQPPMAASAQKPGTAQSPAPTAALELWTREYTITLPMGDASTREALRLQAMGQARDRASNEFGAIVLHEQRLHDDVLSSQTRVLSAGLVRLSLRSETVRQEPGASVFWVDFVIEAKIDRTELERQAAAVRSMAQRDLAIRALQAENEALRKALANAQSGAGGAAAGPAPGSAVPPRASVPDQGYAVPMTDLAALTERSKAQAARDTEVAQQLVNQYVLEPLRAAPKVVTHAIGDHESGYRVLVGVRFNIDAATWKDLTAHTPNPQLLRGGGDGCLYITENNHLHRMENYRLFAAVSIGDTTAYAPLAARWSNRSYCARRGIQVRIVVPPSAFERSREIVVRVLPETEVPQWARPPHNDLVRLQDQL
jgi:hypothetical protein